jgi:hypothetical protein
MDSNILNGLGRWRPLLGSVEAFRKVQHFVDDSKQAIPPAQKGKETIKKHTCVESGPPRQFSVRGFRQPGIRCTQQAGKKAKSEISGLTFVCNRRREVLHDSRFANPAKPQTHGNGERTPQPLSGRVLEGWSLTVNSGLYLRPNKGFTCLRGQVFDGIPI